ncbi:hypothetical protein ACFV0D_23260 [Streptomyces sp. NPDC059556]
MAGFAHAVAVGRAEGLARRTVGLGHGAEGFTRVTEVLGRR